jgi:hypothetical protein
MKWTSEGSTEIPPEILKTRLKSLFFILSTCGLDIGEHILTISLPGI